MTLEEEKKVDPKQEETAEQRQKAKPNLAGNFVGGLRGFVEGDDETEEEQQQREDQNVDRPHHFAGGWQGLDLVKQHEEESGENEELAEAITEEESKPQGRIARVIARFPRTYSVLFKIVIPCFILIILTLIFGAGLARLEWNGEKKNNDEAMARFANLAFTFDQLSQNALSAPERCLKSFEFGDTFNRTALELHMKECGRQTEVAQTRALIFAYLHSQEYDELSFNWMTCSNATSSFILSTDQADHIIDGWTKSYEALRAKYNETHSERDAHFKASSEATGTLDCEPNASAGALFWFTVMTTIGYGNAAPVTTGGRLMVYTLGFCSILLFTALIGQAGHICVTIMDDFFLRCRAKRLTEGMLGTLFWLACVLLWMLAVAGLFISWAANRANQNFPLNHAYWFTFISTTTVGLGDIFIPPDIFKGSDMFYIPFMFLLAFVLLATFLLKFSVMVTGWFPNKGPTLAATLQKSRQENVMARRDDADDADDLSQKEQEERESDRKIAIDESLGEEDESKTNDSSRLPEVTVS